MIGQFNATAYYRSQKKRRETTEPGAKKTNGAALIFEIGSD